MNNNISMLEKAIDYKFKDDTLLIQALTHSSYINENNLDKNHNERLEFLGDAVLELQISKYLYQKFPNEREGILTNLRSGLVNEKSLAKIAKNINLGTFLNLGKGEEKQGGRTRSALLADALEALIGAVFLDGGYRSSQKLISTLFDTKHKEPEIKTQQKSFKTLLQEYTQANFHFTPEYKLISETGPEHSKKFTVSYDDKRGLKIEASGNSHKKAEHEAAKLALEFYNQKTSI